MSHCENFICGYKIISAESSQIYWEEKINGIKCKIITSATGNNFKSDPLEEMKRYKGVAIKPKYQNTNSVI